MAPAAAVPLILAALLYLVKNPGGYCPIHATGIELPDDIAVTSLDYVD